jgi:predicted ATPase
MAAHFKFGPEWRFELRASTRQLLRDGVPVALGSRAIEVLLALLEAGGRLVTKQELLDLAWPGLVVEEANVYVTIAQLRKILGTEAISTVGGLGYRLALPVAATDAEEMPQHNLPAERTEFIGRQGTLREAQERLQQTRLLTLVGIGGTGKTRLALKLAEFALADHRDGVRWVDLAPVASADYAASTLALAVGCKPHGATSALVALKAYCRGLQMLLVLDNCEHVLAVVAQAIDELLAAAPGVRVLATSREALGVAGEVTLHVRPLELPAVNADGDEISRSEAVRLFMHRARSVAPKTALSAEMAPVVAEICRKLDGLPLAIELAAARMRLLSVQQLLGLLDERFLLLTGGARALPRQQTLQAMIHWSYEASGSEAQRALRAMSICGGCDLEVATALLGESASRAAAMNSMTRLVDLGLLIVDHQKHSSRYSMLDTVCQYALEQLSESAEAAVVRDRHRDYFLRFAEDAASHDARRAPHKWMERLELEHENLLRALAWCETGGGAAAGLRFLVALRSYWPARGQLRLGHAIAVKLLSRSGADKRDALRADALIALAQLSWWLGEFRAALQQGQEALSIAEELGNLGLMGWASMSLSYAHGALGDTVPAGRFAEDALRHARSTNNDVQLSDALVAVGDFHFESNHLDRARELYEEAMTIRKQLGFPARQGLVAIGLAEVAIAQHRLDVAKGWLRQAVDLAVETQSRYIGHHAIEQCAALAAATEEWRFSVRWFNASARQREATGMSEATMSHRQRTAALERAMSAMGPTAAAEAGSEGNALSYEQAMAEVAAWLGSEPAESS